MPRVSLLRMTRSVSTPHRRLSLLFMSKMTPTNKYSGCNKMRSMLCSSPCQLRLCPATNNIILRRALYRPTVRIWQINRSSIIEYEKYGEELSYGIGTEVSERGAPSTAVGGDSTGRIRPSLITLPSICRHGSCPTNQRAIWRKGYFVIIFRLQSIASLTNKCKGHHAKFN